MEHIKSLEEKYKLPVLDAAPLTATEARLDGADVKHKTIGDKEVAELTISGDDSREACVRARGTGADGGGRRGDGDTRSGAHTVDKSSRRYFFIFYL